MDYLRASPVSSAKYGSLGVFSPLEDNGDRWEQPVVATGSSLGSGRPATSYMVARGVETVEGLLQQIHRLQASLETRSNR